MMMQRLREFRMLKTTSPKFHARDLTQNASRSEQNHTDHDHDYHHDHEDHHHDHEIISRPDIFNMITSTTLEQSSPQPRKINLEIAKPHPHKSKAAEMNNTCFCEGTADKAYPDILAPSSISSA